MEGRVSAGREVQMGNAYIHETENEGVADRYSDYSKVILVGHGMAFRCLTYIEKMHPGGIVECTYRKGQPECEYSFT